MRGASWSSKGVVTCATNATLHLGLSGRAGRLGTARWVIGRPVVTSSSVTTRHSSRFKRTTLATSVPACPCLTRVSDSQCGTHDADLALDKLEGVVCNLNPFSDVKPSLLNAVVHGVMMTATAPGGVVPGFNGRFGYKDGAAGSPKKATPVAPQGRTTRCGVSEHCLWMAPWLQ